MGTHEDLLEMVQLLKQARTVIFESRKSGLDATGALDLPQMDRMQADMLHSIDALFGPPEEVVLLRDVDFYGNLHKAGTRTHYDRREAGTVYVVLGQGTELPLVLGIDAVDPDAEPDAEPDAIDPAAADAPAPAATYGAEFATVATCDAEFAAVAGYSPELAAGYGSSGLSRPSPPGGGGSRPGGDYGQGE